MPQNNGDEASQSLGAFVCNLCGRENLSNAPATDRETATCVECGSSMRFRSVVLALSRALFGLDLPLSQFPKLKSVAGLGISDSEIYASRLEKIFSYTNTFYHREPFLDLTKPDETDFGKYDFIICSEVLEHIPEPVDRAFQTLGNLLKATGILILTVPYAVDEEGREHYAGLAESGLAEVGGKTVLVGRLPSGEYRVFDNLIFHGGPGSTLEHRLFSEANLRQHLASAGFPLVKIDASGNRNFGVIFPDLWSLPIIAARAPFSLSAGGVTEFVEQITAERARLASSRWLRLGKALGVGPTHTKRKLD